MSAAWRTRLQLALVDIWQQRGPWAWLMAPAAAAHWAVLSSIDAAYRSGLKRPQRLPVPVIVIGNLYVGGTGKTPLTIALVHALRERGWQPGIVSRGYGSAARGAQRVEATADARTVGDEPLLLAQATGVPVAVGRHRVDAARLLLRDELRCDVLIADDGLQHRALGRDLEIALVHYRGLGNGWLLPAGPLRETGQRLNRVDAIVAHGDAPALNAGAPLYRMTTQLADAYPLAGSGPPLPLPTLAERQRHGGESILAAAGIGMPDRFFAMLRAAGLTIEELPLADHYDYTRNPFAECRHQRILITEKDAVKCRANPEIAHDQRIWVVPLLAHVDPALVDYIVARLSTLTKETSGGSPPA